MSSSCENQDDGYSTTFLPVQNPKVEYPAQHKHFSVKMFTFIRDEEVLEDQVRAQNRAQNVLRPALKKQSTDLFPLWCGDLQP